jgi:hypothetical protein
MRGLGTKRKFRLRAVRLACCWALKRTGRLSFKGNGVYSISVSTVLATPITRGNEADVIKTIIEQRFGFVATYYVSRLGASSR